jgi:hypothetical protein
MTDTPHGGPDKDSALVTAFRQAQRRHRDRMDATDRLLDDLALKPGPTVSAAAHVTVAAELALAHARELASLLAGVDLADLAAAPVGDQWPLLRDRLPELGVDMRTAVADLQQFEETLLAASTQILATLQTAGLLCAGIDPAIWPTRDLARLIIQFAARTGLVNEMTDQAEEFLRLETDP